MTTLKEETEDLIRSTLDINGYCVIEEDIDIDTGMSYTQWKRRKKQIKIYVDEV